MIELEVTSIETDWGAFRYIAAGHSSLLHVLTLHLPLIPCCKPSCCLFAGVFAIAALSAAARLRKWRIPSPVRCPLLHLVGYGLGTVSRYKMVHTAAVRTIRRRYMLPMVLTLWSSGKPRGFPPPLRPGHCGLRYLTQKGR